MDRPIVKIKEAVWDKLWQYIMSIDGEISGFGHAYINNERDIDSTDQSIIVEDIFILDQISSGISTEIKNEAIHAYLADEMRLAIKEERYARKLNLWWHSHGGMDTFWSGTDTGTMDSFFNSDWKIHIVGNRRQSYLCKVISYKPIKHDWDDVKIVPIKENNEIVVTDEIKAEVKDKVKAHVSFTRGVTGFIKDVYGWSGLHGLSSMSLSEGDKVDLRSGKCALKGVITKEHPGYPKKYDIFVKDKNETHLNVPKIDIKESIEEFSMIVDEETLKSMVAELDHLMNKEHYIDAKEIAEEIMQLDETWGKDHRVKEIIDILDEIPLDEKSKKNVRSNIENASKNMRDKLIKDEEKETKNGIDKS